MAVKALEYEIKDVTDSLADNDSRVETIKDNRDAEIKEMCEKLGYGAVMDAASRIWQKDKEHGKLGAFIITECVGTTRHRLKRLEAALNTIGK